jgi:hypothetical protein
VTPERVRAVYAKQRSGAALTAAEQALLARLRDQAGSAVPGAPTPGNVTGSYIVFVLRGGKIMAVPITTGLTDQDQMEVTRGLSEADTVLVLSGTAAK